MQLPQIPLQVLLPLWPTDFFFVSGSGFSSSSYSILKQYNFIKIYLLSRLYHEIVCFPWNDDDDDSKELSAILVFLVRALS